MRPEDIIGIVGMILAVFVVAVILLIEWRGSRRRYWP